MLRPPTPAILIGLLAVAACASGGVSAKPVRPRGVVTVAVMDTGGDAAPQVGSVARSAPRSGRATGTSGAYRVHLEEPADAIPIGAVRWLEAIVTDTAGRRVAEAALLWQSSDTTVVTVPRVGRLLAPATGRGDGRALVTVSLGAATASVEVTVGRPAAVATTRPLGAGAVGVAVVRVEPARVDARVGDQVTLRAVAVGARGDTLRACPLRWSTSGAPAAPAGGAAPGGATAVYRVLAAGPVMVAAECEGARGTAVIVVR